MPEERDVRVRPCGFYHCREEREVEILYEYQRALHVLYLLQELFGEFAVHSAVCHPILLSEDGPRVRHVRERPERFVRELRVTFIFARKPYALQCVLRLVGRHAELPARVRRLLVAGAAPVREPHAPARDHHRLERGHQPARGNRPFRRLPSDLLVHVWLATWNDIDEPIAPITLGE